jgi:hypothetical protein
MEGLLCFKTKHFCIYSLFLNKTFFSCICLKFITQSYEHMLQDGVNIQGRTSEFGPICIHFFAMF